MSSDKTAEPSMDEILSSIRKIITEDSTSRPSPTGSAVPLPPAMKTDFGSAGGLPPPARPPVLKPPAVDDVLDELSMDVKSLRSTTPSPSPQPSSAPPLPKSPLPNAESGAPSWLSPRTGAGAAGESSSTVPPLPTVERSGAKPPFGARDLDEEAKAALVLEKRGLGDLGSMIPSRLDAAPPVTPKADLLPHERLPDPNFGRVAKPDSGGASTTPAPGVRAAPATSPLPNAAPAHVNGNHFNANPTGSSGGLPSLESRTSVAATDAPSKAIDAASTPARTPAAMGASASEAQAKSATVAAAGGTRSTTAVTEPGSAKSTTVSAAMPAATASGSTTAAKAAIADALAARPNAPANTAPAQTRPAPTSGQGSTSARTMEDTVVDLLRPMLRQWLDANMPRILEKSLRAELADEAKKKD